MNQQTEIDVKGRQNEEMEIDLLELCIRRNPVAAFAAVSGHGAERVAGVLGV